MASHRTDALLSDLFRDLAVAGRALSAYPPGHPAVGEGLAKAHATLSALLAAAGPVELAAARDAILWGDQRVCTPPAAQLAKLLRRRRAAGLLLDPGATSGELETFLRALAADSRAARAAGSFAAELSAAGLIRIRVSDLDFSSLSLVETDEEAVAPEAGEFAERVVRRLVANGGLPAERLARWIASGRTAAELLRVLLEGGGTGAAEGEWGPGVRAAAMRATADEQGTAAEAEGIAASEPSSSSGPGSGAEAPRLHARHLATLRKVFATGDIDTLRDPETPADELVALLELPEDRRDRVLSPAAAAIGRETQDPGLDPGATEALLELAERVEVRAEALPGILQRLEGRWLRLLSGGGIGRAGVLVERVKRRASGDGPVAAAFLATAERMSGRESIEALVESLAGLPDEGLAAVPALIDRLGPQAVRQLLDVLARTENRRTRLRLLDLIARLGPAVARDATALLSDPRWFVVRNMLLLLRRVGDARSVPSVRRCVDHPDLRVRLEAIHTLFTFDRDVPGDPLRAVLNDRDPRQAEAAVELAGKYGIAEAVDPIVELLRARDPLGKRRAVRLKAIRALAAIGDPRALAGLGRFHSRFQVMPPAPEERRELYRTLPAYPEESYQEWIVDGLRSSDPEIRRLSAAMGPAPGSPR
jgi:HEAT repeat protein